MIARSLFLHLVVVLLLGWSVAPRAADLDEAVVLVAKRELRDSLYGSSVLVAKSVGPDLHVGFIINRPTRYTLGAIFPDHAPSQKVLDPVYVGGPLSPEAIFALVRRHDNPGGRSFQLMQDLFVAFDGKTIDRIIEAEPERARFVAGLVAWRTGELRAEIERGLWHVLEPDAGLALRKPTEGLWEELVRRSERAATRLVVRGPS